MNPHLREVLHIVQAILTVIGGGTVFVVIGWLYKWRQENFEDSVLLMFQNDPHQQFRTAEGVHSDYIRECLKDVPM